MNNQPTVAFHDKRAHRSRWADITDEQIRVQVQERLIAAGESADVIAELSYPPLVSELFAIAQRRGSFAAEFVPV